MNYDEMCDEEVEARVAYHEHDGVIVPLYCSSPADMWPIIAENHIDIEWGLSINGPDSGAARYFEQRNTIIVGDANPLRAAAIVYLKMMEAEK